MRPEMSAAPLDWRRLHRYLAADLPWIRSRIERGDLESALYTLRVVRSYIEADLLALSSRYSLR